MFTFQAIIGSLMLLFIACNDDNYKNKDIPDVSSIDLEVKIKRFEKDLFALDTNATDLPFAKQVEQLETQYPNFFNVFSQRLIADPNIMEASPEENVAAFIKHTSVKHLYDTTMLIYNNIENIETDLTQALKYYKYYLPEKPTPEVVSYISEYAIGTFTYGDSLLGIGWDFFLGKDFHYDTRLFPAYLQRSMNREHLVSKAIEALASNAVGAVEGKRLLDYMITNGKVLYLKSLLLPETSPSVLMEYTPQQTAWIENNEFQLWNYLIEDDLLYSTKLIEFQKLVGPSPVGTSQMPPEAPGKTGNWVGWQIVKAYMALHPEVSMQDLINNKDAQAILTESRYKPKR